MKVFLVYAHPSTHSLNATLKDHAVAALQQAGHEVQVSDLYAMGWKAVADAEDFPERDSALPLDYAAASGDAYKNGTQSADIAAEQEKLLWADAVVFQFPLWWYSMPAILKGWVDRVFALGFAYGRGVHGQGRWGDRFGEGILAGKRAMVCVTLGGRATHYGPRGVNGQIDDILWAIHHGILFYPGMTVLPPVLFYETRRVDASTVQGICDEYVERLLSIETTEPIPYRTQNGGDYDEHQTLKPGLEGDAIGLLVHQKEPRYVANVQLTRGEDQSPLFTAPSSRSKA